MVPKAPLDPSSLVRSLSSSLDTVLLAPFILAMLVSLLLGTFQNHLRYLHSSLFHLLQVFAQMSTSQ